MRKLLAATTLAAVLATGIGGTGHAAPRPILFAYVVDKDGATTSFGRCEDIAGADKAACRKLEVAVGDAYRLAALGGLSKGWKGTRLAALAHLVEAEGAFAHALAVDETGSGSADGAAHEQREKDAFLATVRGLVVGRVSRGDTSYDAIDAALNDAYARVMAVANTRELAWGRVDKAGIRRTERAWLAYRDAFVGFASTLDAPDAADTIRVELTRRRTVSLEGFLED